MDTNIQFIPFFRALSELECEKPIQVLIEGELGDVILRPSAWSYEKGNVSNVPYRLKDAWWFEWGYSGGGPRDAALNILFHFTGGDEHFARGFTLDFVEEVLAKIPNRMAASICHKSILSWIENKRGKKSKLGSFDYGELSPKGMTWEYGSFRFRRKEPLVK